MKQALTDKGGWSKRTFSQLQKLDSFMKEVQRLALEQVGEKPTRPPKM
jgi:hypothetical protein